MGVQYDNFTALNAVGQDSGVSVLTLYAVWKVKVVFDANGGTLIGGITDAEKALAGKNVGEIIYNVNQSASTGLSGSKTGYIFLEWNTQSCLLYTSLPLQDAAELRRRPALQASAEPFPPAVFSVSLYH